MESEVNNEAAFHSELESEYGSPSSLPPAPNGLKLKKKTLYVVLIIFAICFFYFKCYDGTSGDSGKHSVLTVRFSSRPETDVTRIKNTLKIGGMLKCGYNRDYTMVVEKIDKKFDDFGAVDSNGSYYILPAVLNWISSQGWKFQQKFCVNMNDDNAEYYFVK